MRLIFKHGKEIVEIWSEAIIDANSLKVLPDVVIDMTTLQADLNKLSVKYSELEERVSRIEGSDSE